MLMPKRVKRRKVQRGRLKGAAHKGNQVTYGDYGLVALEPAWITSRQIEAARIAMTRYIKRGGSRSSPISPLLRSRLKPEWVPVKARPNTGLQLLSPAELCLKSPALTRLSLVRLCVLQPTSSPSSASLPLRLTRKRMVNSNESK